MRISNGKAVKHLLANGFDEVWLKAHTKFSDTVYCNSGNYKALDLFNLWDGIALRNDDIYFIQVKTNSWPKQSTIIEWCTKYNARGLAINVKFINEEWEVFKREY